MHGYIAFYEGISFCMRIWCGVIAHIQSCSTKMGETHWIEYPDKLTYV